MNLLDLSLPPRESILKYEALVNATDWSEDDKSELLGYLRALGAAREALVDGEIARRNLQAAMAAASDSSRRAKMDPLYDDGIFEVPGAGAGGKTSSNFKGEERAPRGAARRKGHGRRSLLRL